MGILQAFLSLSIGVAFFALLLFVAWYIAIPLIILFLIIGVIGYIRNKLFLYDFQKKMATRFKRENRQFKDNNIIDVDYTEIK